MNPRVAMPMTRHRTAHVTNRVSLEGEKLYEQRARAALPILVRQAKASEPIYYSNLASELGIPNPRNLNFVLGLIGNNLRRLGEQWGTRVPQLQAIVRNKTTDMPGEGFAEFAPDPRLFRRATRPQRKRIVEAMLQEVWAFPRWDDVLQHFGLEAVENRWVGRHPRQPPPPRAGLGESPAHRQLKEYLAAHPEALGLPPELAPGTLEFLFGSGDVVDILFDRGPEWIGVEVKSSVSDDADLVRGIYQCVKYHALMEAAQKVRQRVVGCRMILATDRRLPRELVVLRNTLGVETRVVRSVDLERNAEHSAV